MGAAFQEGGSSPSTAAPARAAATGSRATVALHRQPSPGRSRAAAAATPRPSAAEPPRAAAPAAPHCGVEPVAHRREEAAPPWAPPATAGLDDPGGLHKPASDEGAGPSSEPEAAAWGPEKLRLAHQDPGIGLQSMALAAAVCTAKFIAAQPRLQPRWVMRQVEQVLGDQVLLTPTRGPALDARLTVASGAIGGAALGSVLGPLGTGVGAVLGALATGRAEGLLLPRPEVVTLGKGHHHVLSRMATDGNMYLAHTEVPKQFGAESAALAILAQASARGCFNLLAYAHDEMSGQDVAVTLAKDVRDGVVVWAGCQGALVALALGQQHAAGSCLGHLCGVVLQNPALAMFGALGAGRIALKCLEYGLSTASKEALQAEVVLTTSQSAAAVLINVVGDLLQASLLSRTFLTCACSQAAGVWAHRCWREARRRDAEAQLRSIAAEVLGLAPGYTAEQLRCRWRTLARYSHPDRNQRPDAKQTFAIFSLCRDVLQDAARGQRCPPPAGCFAGLARRLRRSGWAAREDVPPASELHPRPVQQRPGRKTPAGCAGRFRPAGSVSGPAAPEP
uniref:J domain-containing protein n=1 Tax=Alexandrium monilatum TaxID=311494 RepID=A0A7S4RUR2_9DINO